MNRSTLSSFAIIVATAAVCLSPVSVAAQAATGLTTDEVRTAFVEQGYRVSAPLTWWTSDHVTTFMVSDGEQRGSTGRVVMVLVYPDVATAEAERARAQTREAADTSGALSTDAPHLVPGYGPGVWRNNVAIVESTEDELSRRYAAELDQEASGLSNATGTVAPATRPAEYAVDLDILLALDGARVNL
jgi:hypothetical protein